MLHLLLIVLVAASLVGGLVLIGEARKQQAGHPACGRCGYNLIASVGVVRRCPECGADFKTVPIVPIGQAYMRNDLLLMGLGLVLLSPIACCFGSALLTYLLGPGS